MNSRSSYKINVAILTLPTITDDLKQYSTQLVAKASSQLINHIAPSKFVFKKMNPCDGKGSMNNCGCKSTSF